ncbi:MAG TPA: SLC13 family permease, partial [Rhodospirillaceae bacterium]|nr:SLC13 family permease [Rhodospirillaceae bacterium]
MGKKRDRHYQSHSIYCWALKALGHSRHIFPSVIAAATIAVGAALALTQPMPAGELKALALVLPAIALWATGVVPTYVTALAFFTAAMLFKVAPAPMVFSGFESAALWLIFGGLVMGVAVRGTGLGQRLAEHLTTAFGTTYWGVIGGIVTMGAALGFIMPSSVGRVVLLVPIALSLADRFGFAPGSRGRLGVVLAAALGCDAPTFSILPANVPNLVLVGGAETLWHVNFTYGGYLLLHFPVLGLLKGLLAVILIVKLWPDMPRPQPAAAPAPMTADERSLAVLLTLALAFWATDFVHHINPAWISMTAAVLLLLPLPRLGLVGHQAFSEQINY